MRTKKHNIFLSMAGAFIGWWMVGLTPALAATTVTLDQAVHFLNAEGSDVLLDAGTYTVDADDEWLRVTPSAGEAVDALLLEAQTATHEESLTEPLAVSAQGESPDVHHLALLLPDGKRLEAIGTYSGLRSRGTLSLLTIQRLRTLSSTSQSTVPTEFSTPLFGGAGGNRSYNLDCGNQSVLVGVIYKSGLWLDAIGIICQQVNSQTGALGNEFSRGPVGGSGGIAKFARCNNGQVVQGFEARSGQFVHGGALLCSPWNQTAKAPQYSECFAGCPSGRFQSFGSGGDPSDIFFCPSGKVGKAFRGKHGIYIDSLQFVCDFWDK